MSPLGPEIAMLPIILNSLFTRHRKEMADAERARSKARIGQRVPAPSHSRDVPQPPQAEAKPQKSEKD